MLRPWQIEIVPDGKSGKAIYIQVADAIINDIRSGRLRPGDPLPGSRQLALAIGVNRNTVVQSLKVLALEGWTESRERKGNFVSVKLPSFARPATPAKKQTGPVAPPATRIIRFDDGHPDSKIAPVAELARAYRQIFQRKAKWQMMGYSDPLGDPEFREEIARMLNHQRAMKIAGDNVCITRGSQMAMYLTAMCLVKPGESVAVENPGYKPAWATLEAAGAQLLPVRVDKEGLVVDELAAALRKGRKISAIYTTPHRQYPTTVTLSLNRRLQLAALSNQYGFTIIEDDYDNEFHFGFRPVQPLSATPGLRHCVYIGTLSKVVAPALRIGFLATTDGALLSRIAALRRIIDVQGDNIMEQAVLELIREGTVRRHIRKASVIYRSRRDVAAAMVNKYLHGKMELGLPEGGLAFWLHTEKKVNWVKLSAALQAKGIIISTPDNYSYGEPVNGIRIGYASLSEEQMRTGIKALSVLL